MAPTSNPITTFGVNTSTVCIPARLTNAPFTNVKPFKTEWCIHVKLLYLWKQHTNYGGVSLELILTDEIINKISILFLCSETFQ